MKIYEGEVRGEEQGGRRGARATSLVEPKRENQNLRRRRQGRRRRRRRRRERDEAGKRRKNEQKYQKTRGKPRIQFGVFFFEQ